MEESVIKHLEAPTTITRLSQAIREGSKLRPKHEGQPFFAGGSCALGAAYEALGGWVTKEVEDDTWAVWEFVCKRLGIDKDALHFDEGRGVELWDLITTLNDGGKTREQVADWLEAQGH